MYRIVNVTEDMLKWHWEALFERTQKLMEDFRDGNLTIEGKVGRTNVITYIYKVCPDSPTWKFLDKYASGANLWKLLCGSWEDILTIIRDVESCVEAKNGKWDSLRQSSRLANISHRVKV